MSNNFDSSFILKLAIKNPLFSALSSKETEELLSYFEADSYEKGDIIFQQDGSPNNIYIILNGTIDLFRKKEKSDFKIKSFTSGECFGETALLGILSYVASAIAKEKCIVLKLSKSSLHKLSKNNLLLFNKFLFNLCRETCRKLHNTDLFLTDTLYENSILKNNR